MADLSDASPSPIATKPTVQSLSDELERPIGISILAVLHLIGGALLFVVQFFLFSRLEDVEESIRSIGIPPVVLIVGVMFLALLAIASGVGMWKGTKWGWWFASFYYMYSIFRNGSALFTVFSMADQLEGSAKGLDEYVVKYATRLLIHFLLFLYFFKDNVLEFFGMQSVSKPKAVGIHVGICIVIAAVVTSLSRLLT